MIQRLFSRPETDENRLLDGLFVLSAHASDTMKRPKDDSISRQTLFLTKNESYGNDDVTKIFLPHTLLTLILSNRFEELLGVRRLTIAIGPIPRH